MYLSSFSVCPAISISMGKMAFLLKVQANIYEILLKMIQKVCNHLIHALMYVLQTKLFPNIHLNCFVPYCIVLNEGGSQAGVYSFLFWNTAYNDYDRIKNCNTATKCATIFISVNCLKQFQP